MSEFYIQDTRTVVGNSVLWWRPKGDGYTCDLRQAGRYSGEYAKRQERDRPSDRAVPCELAEGMTETHVHFDTLADAMKRTAASSAGSQGGERKP